MRRLFSIISLVLLLAAPAAAQDEARVDVIPEAMPMADEGGQDIVNVLLLGSAASDPSNPGLTDSLLIVSINRTAGAVSVVSIPRDLFVYVPGHDMQKINTAYYYGETEGEPGDGVRLLKEVVRYNLGLEIDFYARVNFNGFRQIIDAVGGIDLTVDCVIRDWRLKSPEMDKQVADNYEMFTLDIGRWRMDGETALWYVRSRKTSSDLDRGRRQQDVLRALWRRLRQQGLLNHLPDVWATLQESVTTDMTPADMAGLLPLASQIELSEVTYTTFKQRREVVNGLSAARQEVLMPQREAVAALMQALLRPPNAQQARVSLPTVALINASSMEDLPWVAADRLELEGFQVTILDQPTRPRQFNHIVDYTGATKGSPLPTLQRVLRVTDDGVQVEADPNRETDFLIYLGEQYQYWTCTRDVIQPAAEEGEG